MLTFLPRRWLALRLKRCVLLSLLLLTILIVTIVCMNLLNQMDARQWLTFVFQKRSFALGKRGLSGKRGVVQFFPDNQNKELFRKNSDPDENVDPDEMLRQHVPHPKFRLPDQTKKEVPVVSNTSISGNSSCGSVLSYDVHLFYYAWWSSKDFDGQWQHWNHKILPNWNKKDKRTYPTGQHVPDQDDLGSSYYPSLGAYSSRDPHVISAHMCQVKKSGAGVLVVSWYPPGQTDENGLLPSDSVIPLLLDAAKDHDIKIALHVEPYADISTSSLRKHLQYVKDNYWDHPAFYKRRVGRRELPMFYIYDSYKLPSEEWTRLFSRRGDLSIRDTDLDALFIGLLVEFKHRSDIKKAKFDGFYTYFAANSFSFGSSWKNWKGLQDFATRQSLLFIPSIGPGYDDTRIRPWNSASTRDRRNGAYYDLGWRTALSCMPKVISITSFNEWGEGTQIESAVPKATKDGSFEYKSYSPNGEDFYLTQTRKWIAKFIEH